MKTTKLKITTLDITMTAMVIAIILGYTFLVKLFPKIPIPFISIGYFELLVLTLALVIGFKHVFFALLIVYLVIAFIWPYKLISQVFKLPPDSKTSYFKMFIVYLLEYFLPRILPCFVGWKNKKKLTAILIWTAIQVIAYFSHTFSSYFVWYKYLKGTANKFPKLSIKTWIWVFNMPRILINLTIGIFIISIFINRNLQKYLRPNNFSQE